MTAFSTTPSNQQKPEPFLKRSNSVKKRSNSVKKRNPVYLNRKASSIASPQNSSVREAVSRANHPSSLRLSSSLSDLNKSPTSMQEFNRSLGTNISRKKPAHSNQKRRIQPPRRIHSWNATASFSQQPSFLQRRRSLSFSTKNSNRSRRRLPPAAHETTVEVTDTWVECLLLQRKKGKQKMTYFKSMNSQICLREAPLRANTIIYWEDFVEEEEEEEEGLPRSERDVPKMRQKAHKHRKKWKALAKLFKKRK
jgi:hypothetical protein